MKQSVPQEVEKTGDSNALQQLVKQAFEAHGEGQFDLATRLAQDALLMDSENVSAHNLIAGIALRKRDLVVAEKHLCAALELQPDAPALLHNLGTLLRLRGEFEASEDHYRRALQQQPRYAEAWASLSSVRRFKSAENEIAEVEKLLGEDGLSNEEQCRLHYAAGKFHDDSGNYSAAFEHYRKGARVREARFDMDQHWHSCERLKECFDSKLLERLGSGGFRGSPTPIFIVGMPRSGTTLVEQILASHPDVQTAGELPDIGAIASTLSQHHPEKLRYPANVSGLDAAVFRGFGQAYCERLKQVSGSASHVIDKMPQNFHQLGLIRLLLPEAKIIDVRRDPRDVCLSCYFQLFRDGHPYSYSLTHLAYYWNLYSSLMAHWRTLDQISLFELDYESLIAEPEGTARRLLEFCGLQWDERCLSFHKRKTVVTTASNWQVRQPMYSSSVARWKQYEEQLGPLLSALNYPDESLRS